MTGSTENNLLLALFKYAHRQSENFTTAAFVHLLRHLIFGWHPILRACIPHTASQSQA